MKKKTTVLGADVKTDFDALVGRIQATSDALQQDTLVVINRSVTTRAWLTGYYIVEYEQHGADRAKYGEGDYCRSWRQGWEPTDTPFRH